MKKAWSITTTIRNPERLIGLLKIVGNIEGEVWSEETQKLLQILLIKYREYGYGNRQFYNGLSKKQIETIDNDSEEISRETAREIFNSKNYKDPAMRGRQSLNPLKKLGFITVENGKVEITELGKKIISEEIDLGEAFLRCFLKWQLPNLASNDYSLTMGYNIVPFIATIHLINAVNQKEKQRGNKEKGLSKREFSLFVPTLINYNKINEQAERVLEFRDRQIGKNKETRKWERIKYRHEFAKDFLETSNENTIKRFLKDLKDYGDNTIRYFRLTKLFYIRGNGYYIDLEPRRAVEISSIINSFSGAVKEFKSQKEYLAYMSDYNSPSLPWDARERKIEILTNILKENVEYERQLGIKSANKVKDIDKLSDLELSFQIIESRKERSLLQETINHKKAQDIEELKKYINNLQQIYKLEDRAILLEKLATMGLHALNDAINIKPNYPVGDDNEPTFTAPSGVPDIECYYKEFDAICEVTMLTSRDQWYNEGQPVMRHLREFELLHNKNRQIYCLFIAPSIHRDTANTFWIANKYEYEGKRQRIIPLTILQFIEILQKLLLLKSQGGNFSHKKLIVLYEKISGLINSVDDSEKWLKQIQHLINNWNIDNI